MHVDVAVFRAYPFEHEEHVVGLTQKLHPGLQRRIYPFYIKKPASCITMSRILF